MNINQKAITTLKMLGIDMINNANSGHPGIVLGAAPIMYALFIDHLKSNPKQPKWINRDRFVLSAGHGSALLYAMLHLAGYPVSLDNLKFFRKDGNTPGHPEYGATPGVDMTTGPLGQGLATSVGFAIAEANLRARFNKDGFNVFDHYTYCLCGDGDLQEGISHEAISFAGVHKLNKLIVLYDSNNVQLDSETNLVCQDNVKLRFQAAGWNYILVQDGENYKKISAAIKKAKESSKPTLIEVKTVIGAGSKFENTSKVHGAPLSEEDINNLRAKLEYNQQPFNIPLEVYEHFNNDLVKVNEALYEEYEAMFEQYKVSFTDLNKNLEELLDNKINFDLAAVSAHFDETKNYSGRDASGIILKEVSKDTLKLIGGSADLSASTKVLCNAKSFSSDSYFGRNIYFGVREHLMAAIANGLSLYGLFRPFVGGFFVFSDYMKPAMRLSALMKLPVMYIFTHDSIHVGEDGPTHQPIEQLQALRAIPNFITFRPCDYREVIGSYDVAFDLKLPSAMVLSRQDLTTQPESKIEDVRYGAYIISREKNKLDGILVATGSEVELAMQAKKLLTEEGYDIRVISMPSVELFKIQSSSYKSALFPLGVKTVAVEAGSPDIWYQFAKNAFGLTRFGLSDNAERVITKLDFNAECLAKFFKNALK